MGKQQEVFMKRSATFGGSDNSPWRYHLGRFWSQDGLSSNLALWIMLNPSTADAYQDGPTIRKCIAFSKLLGHDGCVIVNLFSFRTAYPGELKKVIDPIGADNDKFIMDAITNPWCKRIICAWGKNGSYMGRGWAVMQMIADSGKEAYCLRQNKDGSPEHPLYVPYSVEPMRYA